VVSASPAWIAVTTSSIVVSCRGAFLGVLAGTNSYFETEKMTDKWTNQRTLKRTLMSKMMGDSVDVFLARA
jgi:hypothetical protein